MTHGEQPELAKGVCLVSSSGVAAFHPTLSAIDDIRDYLRDRLTVSSESDFGEKSKMGVIVGVISATFALGWLVGANQSIIINVNRASHVGRADSSSMKKVGRPKAADSAVRPVAWSRATPGRVKLASDLPVDLSVRAMPRLTPVADTKPISIEGWTVRYVQGTTAVLEGPGGVITAARGDIVPGVGRIESIVLWGGRWIVATTEGLITTP
jgi:hypothetical protein